MKYFHSKLLHLFWITLICAIVIWYIYENREAFYNIELVNPSALALVVIIFLINIYAAGMIFEVAVYPHGIKLSFHEIIGLAAIIRFANHTLPVGIGAFIRALYLKKKYDVNYLKFTSSFTIASVLQIIFSIVVAVSMYLINNFEHFQSAGILFAIGICFVLFLFILLPANRIAKHIKYSESKLLRRLYYLLIYYDAVKSEKYVLIKLCFWVLILLTTTAINLLCIYYVLGYYISFIDSLFIASVTVWGMIISFTPGNIGIREGLMVVGASIMDVSVPETIVVAVLFRILAFIISFALTAFYAPKLLNKSLFKLKDIEIKMSF